jgi:hypothetical protein
MKEDYDNKEFRHYVQQARAEFILNICKLTATNVYVELGTRRFTNINIIAPYIDTVVGVDMLNKWYNQKLAHKTIKFYHMSTDEFLPICKEKYPKIDVLFIDADHSHKQSYIDFCNYKDLVKDQGIILLHDTFPPAKKYFSTGYCNDVWKTAKKIKEEHSDECEICTIPGGFGIGVIRMHRGKYTI